MSIQIRKAGLTDAAALSDLVLRNARQTLFPHYSTEQWNVFIQYYSVEAVEEKIRTQEVFIAFDGDRMAGTIALEEGFVLGFYTGPSFMGRGVGTALLQFLESYAGEKGLEQLELAASPVAVSFYTQRGWEVVGEEWFVYKGVKFWETRMRRGCIR